MFDGYDRCGVCPRATILQMFIMKNDLWKM
uniref:Uncharacterized protein n=1 Tax=Anguilla anguilla TaxID=7936 RepID=A0A0E9PR74_ANGAN